MRILFIGDVIGAAGLKAIDKYLPGAISDWKIDVTIVNGENSAANGFGITEVSYNQLVAAGADAVTLGNHAWHQKEVLKFIEGASRLIRPINYAPGAPGRGSALIETRIGQRVLVINALGRLFMDPVDDPFRALDSELKSFPLQKATDAIVVDFHCEATGEKQAAGHFCDGRASLVVGTHTHIPSADHQILSHGTAYMTDAGMTGDYDSVVGMQKHEPLRRFTTGLPLGRFEPSTGDATMCGVAVETDDATGFAVNVAAVRLGGRLQKAIPEFWS